MFEVEWKELEVRVHNIMGKEAISSSENRMVENLKGLFQKL